MKKTLYYTALTDAYRHLGELHDVLQGLPENSRLPSLFRVKETLAGLKFEGCSSTLEQLLTDRSVTADSDSRDWREFLPDDEPAAIPLIRIGMACLVWHKKEGRWDTTDVLTIRLVTDLLRQEESAVQPYLCIGDYFYRNRSEYHYAIEISIRSGNPEYWLEFFLAGIRKVAQAAVVTVTEIFHLRKKIQDRIISASGQRLNTAFRILEYLLRHPVVDTNQIADGVCVDISTANRIIRDFLTLGILVQCTGRNRNRRVIFEEYVALFR